MKKLKLNIEALEVASFETDGSPEAKGTVRANNDSIDDVTCIETCIGDTCWDSCGYDCTTPPSGDTYQIHSCAYTCGCTNAYYQSCTYTGC